MIKVQRRREDPIAVNIPAEITGIDRSGRLFSEQTFVKDVTDIGCHFETRTRLQCGDIAAVKPLEPGEKIMTNEQYQFFEVMWAANHGSRCTVGTRRLQGEKLANAKFPPPNYSPRLPAK
ncbi:MAG: hypothetical protein JWN92_1132 [Candidatus Acidoferrum typicum]|nr:hypothetical protein [Candidatus Acidoferrum typicum]